MFQFKQKQKQSNMRIFVIYANVASLSLTFAYHSKANHNIDQLINYFFNLD